MTSENEPAPTTRRIRLIANGKVAQEPALRSAVHSARQRGHEVEVRATWEPGDAARYALEAEHSELERVVIAGGDGSLNEVVSGLFGTTQSPRIELGLVAMGTANDFAHGCHLTVGDPVAALQFAAEGPSRPIDVGTVNGAFFVNVASGGFGALVTANTPPEMKQALGGAAYSLTALVTAMQMTAYHARIRVEGRDREERLIVLGVGNGRLAGGGFTLAPQAILDDGLFDVLLIHDVELPQFAGLLGELLEIDHPENRHVQYLRLAEFEVFTEEELQLNLDGEPYHGRAFDFRVLPRCLRFVLPAAAPLTSRPTSDPTTS